MIWTDFDPMILQRVEYRREEPAFRSVPESLWTKRLNLKERFCCRAAALIGNRLAVNVLLTSGAAAIGERGISRARPDELVCMDSSWREMDSNLRYAVTCS